MDTNKFFSFSRIAMVMKREIMENWKTNLYRLIGIYAAFALVMVLTMSKQVTYSDSQMAFQHYCSNIMGTFAFIIGIFGIVYAANIMENMITKENIGNETFESMTINDTPALFTDMRIDRNAVPEGLYAYDIRESDDGDRLATIEPTVMVNHGGTILTRKEFITEKDGYVQIDEYGFEASMTLEEWLEENN